MQQYEIGLCDHETAAPVVKAGPYATMQEAAEECRRRNDTGPRYQYRRWYWARVGEMPEPNPNFIS